MNNRIKRTSHIVMILAMGLNAQATSQMKGQEVTHQSAKGIIEKCVMIDRVPEGSYSEGDLEEEKEFCELDFYSNSIALCPKVWSTSAGTIVNSLAKSNLTQSQAEQTTCSQGKANPLKSVAKYKQTMNQNGTSGTFSKSSLLYYHYSRYLETTLDIPVAVMRTMDKDMHLERVTLRARPPANARMNANAWSFMQEALSNPNGWSDRDGLFTPDRTQIYGALLKDKGQRYGSEIIGLRQGQGYPAQNDELQQTPSFLALASPGDLQTAIRHGIQKAFQNSAMKEAFRSEAPSTLQMVLWMNEMSEMAVLDYVFSQQDRVGNIDFRWYWMFVDGEGNFRKAKVQSEVSLKSKGTLLAKVVKTYAANDNSDDAQDARMYHAIRQYNPILVQKTMIGDNDAGGRVEYANFTKRQKFLEKFKHLNPRLYKKIIKMDLDFKSQGALYSYFKETFGLDNKQFNQIISNTASAAQILKSACESDTLKFDLVSHKNAAKNEFTEETLNCSNP